MGKQNKKKKNKKKCIRHELSFFKNWGREPRSAFYERTSQTAFPNIRKEKNCLLSMTRADHVRFLELSLSLPCDHGSFHSKAP